MQLIKVCVELVVLRGHFTLMRHHLGSKCAAIIRSREVAENQGFLSTILNGDAVGIQVSGHYRQGGRSSEVVVERSSTVVLNSKCDEKFYFD